MFNASSFLQALGVAIVVQVKVVDCLDALAGQHLTADASSGGKPERRELYDVPLVALAERKRSVEFDTSSVLVLARADATFIEPRLWIEGEMLQNWDQLNNAPRAHVDVPTATHSRTAASEPGHPLCTSRRGRPGDSWQEPKQMLRNANLWRYDERNTHIAYIVGLYIYGIYRHSSYQPGTAGPSSGWPSQSRLIRVHKIS
jgi:hypothetical protein